MYGTLTHLLSIVQMQSYMLINKYRYIPTTNTVHIHDIRIEKAIISINVDTKSSCPAVSLVCFNLYIGTYQYKYNVVMDQNFKCVLLFVIIGTRTRIRVIIFKTKIPSIFLFHSALYSSSSYTGKQFV